MAEMTPADVPDEILLAFSDAETEAWHESFAERLDESQSEPPEQCRPVTVEVDGEQITTIVRGQHPMSEEGRAAWAEFVGAVKRKLAAEPPRWPDLCTTCGFRTGSRLHRRRCEGG